MYHKTKDLSPPRSVVPLEARRSHQTRKTYSVRPMAEATMFRRENGFFHSHTDALSSVSLSTKKRKKKKNQIIEDLFHLCPKDPPRNQYRRYGNRNPIFTRHE